MLQGSSSLSCALLVWIFNSLSWRSLIFSFVFPKEFLFHLTRSVLVTDRFFASLKPWEPSTLVCQAFSTTILLSFSLVHIASNRKGQEPILVSKLVSSIIGLWSELELQRCLTPALGNKVCQPWSHKHWSNLSLMLARPSLLFDHVKEGPMNPKSGGVRIYQSNYHILIRENHI